jgi:hypothetical protein
MILTMPLLAANAPAECQGLHAFVRNIRKYTQQKVVC